ncbi:MAG: DUF3291 domain-containing protein [Candidatus Accumulibacter sp.]|nr:DUF3291 domain-containing protein [Accumulibacter sp.]
MSIFHIAQVNVARAKADMESEIMQGFVSRLDEINALADCAEGFVWRLQEDSGSATSIRVFDDPLLLVNLSVWKNLESLKQYVYKSLHVELIRDREGWFNKMGEAHQALWWVPAGHIPSVQEAKQKLEHIRKHGPTPEAFTFAKAQPMPSHLKS